MPQTYTCAVCKEEFTSTWSDEEAKAELDKTFDVPVEECVVVCDDCYSEIGFGND